VRQEAALGRAGGARGIDVEAEVRRRDRRVAGGELLLVASAAALTELVEGDRVVPEIGPARVEDDDELELRKLVPDLADLGQLLCVLDEDRA